MYKFTYNLRLLTTYLCNNMDVGKTSNIYTAKDKNAMKECFPEACLI